MKFKDELHNIEIPTSLSKRSKQGITLATKEQTKKPPAFIPLLATIIVTAAMILFVLNFNEWMPIDSVSSNGDDYKMGLHPAYIIAIVITCLTVMTGCIILFTKRMKLIWIIMIVLSIFSITWNIVEKEAHQLLEPEIMFVRPFIEGYNAIPITYFTNKEDKREIEKILINNIEYDVYNPGLQDPSLQNLIKYQNLHHVFLQIDLDQLLSLESLEMKAVFNDGSKYEIPTFPIQQYKEMNKYLNNTYNSNKSNITSKLVMKEDTFHLQQIILPKMFINNVKLTIHVTPYNEIAQEVKNITEESYTNKQGEMIYKGVPTTNVINLDVILKKQDRITIGMKPIHNTYYHLLAENILYFSGDSLKIPIVNFEINYPTNYDDFIKTIINQQRGETHE